MTILDLLEGVPGATSTPKKAEIGSYERKAKSTTTTQQTCRLVLQTAAGPSELSPSSDGSSTPSSSSSVCLQRVLSLGDSSDDVHCFHGGDGFCAGCLELCAVLHDHCYPEKVEWVVPSPRPPPTDGASMDESLQNLFDNCDVDAVFLAEAKPTFQQFLDDVMDSSDVPADVMFLSADDADCRVPTKSSSCLTGTPFTPCLFTCPGSTETKLTASVAGARVNTLSTTLAPLSASSSAFSTTPAMTSCVWSSSAWSPHLSAFDFSSSSSSSFSSSLFHPSSSSSSSSNLSPSISDSFAFDSELLEALDSLSPPEDDCTCVVSGSGLTSTNASDLASFSFTPSAAAAAATTADDAAIVIRVNDNENKTVSHEPLPRDVDGHDSLSVTMSHRIPNGVCVFCSPASGGDSMSDADRLLQRLADDDDDVTAPPSACHRDSNNNNNNNNDDDPFVGEATTFSPPPVGHDLQLSEPPSTSPNPSSCCGKRKGEGDCESPCKRARLHQDRGSSSPSSPSTAPGVEAVAGGEGATVADANTLRLSLSRAVAEKDMSARRGRVLQCLSFVKDGKLSDFHPLSPIINQFGRCG